MMAVTAGSSVSLIPPGLSSEEILASTQVRDLFSSFRINGLSLEQVKAAINYTCFSEVCYEFELVDLFQELDRRYFLVQNLRWEFSMLDVLRSDLLPVKSAKYLMTMVHKNQFSVKRWNDFINKRPFPDAPIAFSEIEVELCNIPHRSMVEIEEEEEEKIEEIPDNDLEDEEAKREERKRRRKENAEEADRLAQEAAQKEKDLNELIDLEREVSDSRRLGQLQREMGEQRHRKVRYNLKHAINERKQSPLNTAVKNFEGENLEDTDGDLAKGKRLLDILEAKERLLKAIESKDIGAIVDAMKYITDRRFDRKLQKEMQFAELMIIRLRRLERIRAEVLKLNQPTVAELKSYSFPPPQVHQVMTATFTILGHAEKECKDWRTVQILIGKTGKDGLKRRCLGLQPTLKFAAVANKAKSMLSDLDLEAVRDISAGAATFYLWCDGIIAEVESLSEELTMRS